MRSNDESHTTTVRAPRPHTEHEMPRGARALRSARSERSVAREGLVAGAFAAAGVALAFAVLDVRLVEPLFTPALLGYGMGRLFGIDAMTGSSTAAAIGYTLFHFAAFIALATVVSAIVRRAREQASVLAGALLVVAIAELGFYGFVALLGQTSLTAAAAWPQLVLGNVLGCLLLGGWMWRAHPELQRECAQAVDGTEPAPAS